MRLPTTAEMESDGISGQEIARRIWAFFHERAWIAQGRLERIDRNHPGPTATRVARIVAELRGRIDYFKNNRQALAENAGWND